MDIADRADELQQLHLDNNIQNIKRAAANTQRQPPKGCCYFCEEPLGEAQLFCDQDCTEDFRRLERAQSQKVG